MAKIKSPGDRFPSDDVRGPNWVGTTAPGFSSKYRNKSGDVGSTTDYVGQKSQKDDMVFPQAY